MTPVPLRTPVDPSYLRDLFSRNARTYDAVNALISLGLVERWRRELVTLADVRPDDAVLDAFAGPGSLARYASARLGPAGRLVLADLSPVMLAEARRRLQPEAGTRAGPRRHRRDEPPGRGSGPRLEFVTADVLAPETDLGRFDVVLVGFGLRYVPDVPRALDRFARCLRPGGRLAVLEFTRPSGATLARPSQWYFSRVLPQVAAALAGDAEIYQYLRASSAAFLTADELAAAFVEAEIAPLTTRTRLGGLVASVVGTVRKDRPSSPR
jgi:demethylmenaquinone methyltransferase / 2-methoxy-6-polyprenyl-1,4-benzoquinol methylase